MQNLVKSPIDENQLAEKELEELYGGASNSGCTFSCGKYSSLADEDDQENVVF